MHVLDVLVGSTQPLVTALALLPLADVLGAADLRRSRRTTVTALAVAFVLSQFILVVHGGTQSDDVGAPAVLAVIVFLGGFAHYLLSIHRTRATVAS
jgi:hypothetical protein